MSDETSDPNPDPIDLAVTEERSQLSEYPHTDGGFIIIGPECFAKPDGSVLSWKGVNYVPQNQDGSVEAQVQKFAEDMDTDEADLDSCASPRAKIDPSVPQ